MNNDVLERVRPEFHEQRTLVGAIVGSIETHQYWSVFQIVKGEVKDILREGLVSCAYYVSCLLQNRQFIGEPYATVRGLVEALKRCHWEEVPFERAQPGDVLIWEEKQQADGGSHQHAGFYVGGEWAVSHSDSVRAPAKHHVTFEGTRKIIAVYTHPDLHKYK